MAQLKSETPFKHNKRVIEYIQLFHTVPKMRNKASRDVPRCAGPQGLDCHLVSCCLPIGTGVTRVPKWTGKEVTFSRTFL